MKIASIRVRSRLLAPDRRGFLVRIEDERGALGVGEASPHPRQSPEEHAACRARLAFASAALPGAVIEPDVLAIDALLGRPDLDLGVSPSARFALETALLDLLARREATPLHALLAGANAPARAVPCAGHVRRGATGEELRAAARAARSRGLRTLEAKIDPSLVRDRLGDLERLRDAFDGALRFDASGTFEADEVAALFDRVAPLSPELIAEPTRGAALLGLGDERGPWAPDESLADPELAEALVARASCAAIVLKPAVLGGLLRARALAERAEERGLGVVVAHAFDGPVALAAACELSLSLREPPLACGLDTHEALSAWPTCPVPQVSEPGWVTAALDPGLGLDPAQLES